MDTGLLEIGAVARLLGIPTVTIRRWERNYQLVVPQRGEQGQRLYDSQQVVTLRRVAEEVRLGARAGVAHARVVAAPQPTRTLRVPLAPSSESPSLARRAVDALLQDCDDARLAFNVRLVASELVKNAVIHRPERDPLQLELVLYADWLEMRVDDGGGRFTMGLRTKRGDGGHGLEIIDALSESWSISTGPFGTDITVRLPYPA